MNSYENCNVCQGAGLIKIKAIKCNICNGKICMYCENKSGFKIEPYRECHHCNGNGYK